MSLSWKPLLVGLALTACAPSTTPPTQVMAIDVINHGVYAPSEVSLFAKDISALKGDAANFIGGARIVIDLNDPLRALPDLTPQQQADIFLKQKGLDVRVNYLTRNGVLWPVDFHSWNMVTLYYNFERAYSYFNSLGLLDPVTELSGSTVYYSPEYLDGSPNAQPSVDNLLWQPAIQGFVILPFQNLQAIPLAMNRGAVAHEYSHRIWNRRVEGGLNIPITEDWWILYPPAFKIYQSFNEGLADYHAVESLCLNGVGVDPQCDDTLFLEASLGERAAQERNFKKENNCLTADLLAALETDATTGDTFFALGLQYEVGTVIGASLYSPGKNQKALQGAVLAAYDDPVNGGIRQLVETKLASPGEVTRAAMADIIVKHISQQNLKAAVCAQFLDRLRLDNSITTEHSAPDLPSCPASVAPAGVCKPL